MGNSGSQDEMANLLPLDNNGIIHSSIQLIESVNLHDQADHEID
jgi:hypothetical protein